jgi:hypothetical protein
MLNGQAVNFLEVIYGHMIGFTKSYATDVVIKSNIATCAVTAAKCSVGGVTGGEAMTICLSSIDFSSLGCRIVGIEDLILVSASTSNTQTLITQGSAILTKLVSATSQCKDSANINGNCISMEIVVFALFGGKTDLQVARNAIIDLDGRRHSVKVNMSCLLQGNQADGPIDGYISVDEWPKQNGADVIFGAFAPLSAAVGAAGFLMI